MQGSKKLLLLGTGGHCTSIADSLLALEHYDQIGLVTEPGFLDQNNELKELITEIPIVGDDNDLLSLYKDGYRNAFISVGSVRNPAIRKMLYKKLKEIGFYIPNIIDRSSTVSKHVTLGEGIYIGKNAVVNAYSSIGNCAIINTASVIEHQCEVASFAHIAPKAVLCGKVIIGSDTHIGAGSIIKQGVHIGSGTMIGMGSVVLNDIGDHVLAYGNPCKIVKSNIIPS